MTKYEISEYEGDHNTNYYTEDYDTIDEAIYTYLGVDDDSKINKLYEVYKDEYPNKVTIITDNKIYAESDNHEITQEEYNKNPDIDYLNDDNYYSVNYFTIINVLDDHQ